MFWCVCATSAFFLDRCFSFLEFFLFFFFFFFTTLGCCCIYYGSLYLYIFLFDFYRTCWFWKSFIKERCEEGKWGKKVQMPICFCIRGLKMKHEMLKHEMLDAGAFHGKIDISKQLLAFGRFVIYLMAIKVKKKVPEERR